MNPLNQQRRSRVDRNAFVLVIVLIVVFVLALGAYSFCDLMLAHADAVSISGRQIQARYLVDSGIDYLKLYLMQDKETIAEAGGIYDNPAMFQAIPVVYSETEADLRGNFTIIGPALDTQGSLAGARYGLEDESSRLNLNTLLAAEEQTAEAGRDLLMALPGMTFEIADSILDWIDIDDGARDYGVESDYYGTLNPPYACKNGPLDTVEELLLIRGVSPQLLFGRDINRNGTVDAFEMMSQSTSDTTVTTNVDMTDRGWSGYLTLHSLEKNFSAQGFARIDVNQEDLASLYEELDTVFSSEWANFIVAYRQFGPATNSSGNAVSASSIKIDTSVAASTSLFQVLDLIGAQVQVPAEGDNEPKTLRSPFAEEIGAMGLYLPLLMDNITINSSETIPGRININQAPYELLLGIPGITEEIVEQIIQEREYEPALEDLNRTFETWIMARGIVTLQEMKTLQPFINGGGDVFRGQVIGYFEDGSASSRVEILLDRTTDIPKLIQWRDLSQLGRGYPLETLGVQLNMDATPVE
ncbi:MAG: type II secretory pathway component PulK [Pirellulaceae bacterium]|jgi:type II secretory pathway component PulK